MEGKHNAQELVKAALRTLGGWMTIDQIYSVVHDGLGHSIKRKSISAALNNGNRDPGQPAGLVAKGLVAMRTSPHYPASRQYRLLDDGQQSLL